MKRSKKLFNTGRENQIAVALYILDQIKGKVFVFSIIVLISSIMFSIIEGWDFFTALYFTLVTVSTVGYGDLTPSNPISRELVIFVILAGISTFTLILQTLVTLAFENRTDPMFLSKIKLRKVKNHVIVLGYGSVGTTLSLYLRAYQVKSIVVVDKNQKQWERAHERGYIAYLGDISDPNTLKSLKLETAQAVFITVNDDETAILSLLQIRSINPKIPLYIHVKKEMTLEMVKEIENTSVVWENHAMVMAINEDLFQVPGSQLQTIIISQNTVVTWVYSSEETSLGALNELIQQEGVTILGYVDPITQEFTPLRRKPDPWEIMGNDLIVVGKNTELQKLESFDLDHFVTEITHDNILIIGYSPEIRHAMSVIAPLAKKVQIIEWRRKQQELATIDGYELIKAHPLDSFKIDEEVYKNTDLVIINGLEDKEAVYTIMLIRNKNKKAVILSSIANPSYKPFFIKAGANHFLDPKRITALELFKYYASEIEATKIYFANGRLELVTVTDPEEFLTNLSSDAEILYYEVDEETQPSKHKFLLFIPI